MTIRKGKAFRNLLRDGSGNTISHPVYHGIITAEVESAIQDANALTPVREGAYIDPYYRAIENVRNMGIDVKFEHTTKEGR